MKALRRESRFTLHQASGGHHAADGGHRAGGHLRLPAATGGAVAPGGSAHHLGAGDPAGASPDTVAATVASPLERHLGQIADVTQMTSSSSAGNTRIVLQFGLDRDIDGAARDVEAAINAARADLPASLRSNPTYRKVNPADSPVAIIALTSNMATASPASGATRAASRAAPSPVRASLRSLRAIRSSPACSTSPSTAVPSSPRVT